MVRHIVSWKFADGNSFHTNHMNAVRIKNELEYLPNVIDGITCFEVIIDPLESSNVDIILNSQFIDETHLKRYQMHPEHKKVADFINKVTKDKVCMDYID